MEKQTMQLRGGTCLQLSIFFILLNLSGFLIPVKGYALKNCRITNGIEAICEKSQLKAIPQDIPARVRSLDLSANVISNITISDFKNVPNLTRLDLKRNRIAAIEDRSFSMLTFLNVLILNNNKLVKLQDNLFYGLSNLTELRLTSNHINAVASSAFQSLTNLTFLDLSNNKLYILKDVHSIFHQLPNLRELSIQGNKLSIFRSWELSNTSTRLAALDLSQNPIKVFNITTDMFPSLTRLNLGRCGTGRGIVWDVRNETFLGRVSSLDISGLHLSFDAMKTFLESLNSSLTSLRLNAMRSDLQALINVSCKIPSLTTLKLQRNKLKDVTSNTLRLCSTVTELDLSDNLIKHLSDDSFKSLQRLRILSLKRNCLSSVPGAIRSRPTLGELDLSFNKISAVGCKDFAGLTRLQHLHLCTNPLTALGPCVFKDLRKLQYLKLQNNTMTNLNGAFKENLPNLKILDLFDNKLTAINREEFKGLQSLQNLSLEKNQITRLERGAFIGLTNLTTIHLGSNQLDSTQLNQRVFSDLKNVRRLLLMDNHIQYKSDKVLTSPPFTHLSSLETLLFNGQHRRLKSHIPRNFLQGLTNLSEFSARNMQLTSFHVQTFNYTPNLRKLDISSNELAHIPASLFSPLRNLKSLYISRTNLRSLDFILQSNLTEVEYLQVRKNSFSVINETVMESLPSLNYLDMQGNSFTCDCDNAGFLQWVETNRQTQVFDAYNFECNYPSVLTGMRLLDLDVHSCSVDVGFVCLVSTACAVLLVQMVAFTYHLLRWQLVYAYYLLLGFLFNTKRRNVGASYQYDAFISYNVHDELWVLSELLPKLEDEQGWRLCLHHRDFQPGKPIIDNITDAIYGSRKTICVISRRYLESEWCSREIQVASFRLFDEQKDVLILVFLEDIPTAQLSPYYRMRKLLKRRTYLSWPRADQHTELFWEKVRQAMGTKEGPAGDALHLNLMEG